jgi:hypothetical protein
MNEEVTDAEQAAEQPEAVPEQEPETYSAEYVKELRAEAAERRVKAKKVDAANERLARAYAAQDGRLIDAAELQFDPSLLDDDGLVDAQRVSDRISTLLQSKPYLASMRPVQPVAQGVREDLPEQPGLFALLRERA